MLLGDSVLASDNAALDELPKNPPADPETLEAAAVEEMESCVRFCETVADDNVGDDDEEELPRLGSTTNAPSSPFEDDVEDLGVALLPDDLFRLLVPALVEVVDSSFSLLAFKAAAADCSLIAFTFS